MASDVEWVEIKCPRTGEPMFANLETGECLWEPPVGATVKVSNKNQWWELYDPRSDKHYYHNAISSQTVWKKPPDAEILPLTKLQPTEQAAAPPQRPPGEESRPSPTTLDRNSLHSKLPPLSPWALKPATALLKPNSRGKLPPPVASKPATLKRPGSQINGAKGGCRTQGEDTPSSSTEPAGGSDRRTNTQPDKRHSQHGGEDPPPLDTVKQVEFLSDPITNYLPTRDTLYSEGGRKSIENLSNLDADVGIPDIPFQSSNHRQHPPQPSNHRQHPPQPSTQAEHTATQLNMDKLKQERLSGGHESRFSSFHDYSAPAKYSSNNGAEGTPPREQEDGFNPAMRRHSAELSPANHKDKKGSKKPVVRSPTSPIPKLPKEKEFVKKNINRHRNMFKKVSIATMLAHSKDPIKKPIILTRDREVRRDAVIWFKNLQEYMGDSKSGKGLRDRERLKKAAELSYTGWQKVCFRDEFFMQVIKQTTCNPKPRSLEWGWKLLTVYLYYFPPTIRFQGYLEGYLYKNKENDLNQTEVPVQMYAEYCHERLAKMIERGAKHGQKKPTEEDVVNAMQLPFKKSMWGATLAEVMELQKSSHPDHHLPWVLSMLAGKVLLFGGHCTEGIFRVPGDIDKVGSLKIFLDNGEYSSNEFPTTDAPVCASLLKEWLRELYDPVISHETYQKCLDSCEHPGYCTTLIAELPDINRLVVTFVIRFLQGFLQEDIVKRTKMTPDNLAMVFAPNLLRCTSTDLQVAMDNSKWEMTFVRTLLTNLDTSYMEGVV